MKAAVTKINREIMALAAPNVISNVSVPLISSVDTYLMGQLSMTSVAAVGLGSMVFNFLYWNMGFLRMGTTGMTAQAFGRKDHTGMASVLLKAGLLAFVISCFFVLFQNPLFDLAAWAMAVEPERFNEVRAYFSIRILGAPGALLLMALMGWLFGMQNATYPLWVTIFINVINIVLSAYLVRQLDMGIEGAAWGTLIAQYAGLLLCMLLILYRYKSILTRDSFSLSTILAGIGDLIRINKDIFLRTLFLSTAILLIFRFSKEVGVDILAINVVFLQFLNWMSYAVDGFAYAAESLVGKYKGAQDSVYVELAVKWNMIWGFGFAILFSLVYTVFAEDIFQLFMESDTGQVMAEAKQYFFWMALLPVVGFACYIWDGIFVGLTASVSMRNSMFGAFIFYLATYFLLPADLGNHRIWAAFFVFLIGRGLVMWYLYRRYGWDGLR